MDKTTATLLKAAYQNNMLSEDVLVDHLVSQMLEGSQYFTAEEILSKLITDL